MGNSYSQDMNSTFHSVSTDAQEEHRWASFEYYPSRSGKNRVVYMGIFFKSHESNMEDLHKDKEDKMSKERSNRKTLKSIHNIQNSYWSKKKCVVKSVTIDDFDHKDKYNEECQWFRKLFLKGVEFSVMFSKEFSKEEKPSIVFAEKYLAQVDNMPSFWNPICMLFGRFKKRLREGEYVLLEDRIKGNFQQFVFIDGTVNENCPDIVNTFVHFSYHQSSGKLVICDFQGVADDHSNIHLTTPSIHSVEKSYGPKDQGEDGIREVFKNHKCNHICGKDWIKL